MSEIKVMQICVRVCLLLICLLFFNRATGDMSMSIPGATEQESREVMNLVNMCGSNQEGALKGYEALVQKNPKNRPARLFLAYLQIQMGRTEAAKSELAHLRTKNPKFPGVTDAEAELWRILGNKKMEVETCMRILNQKHEDTEAAQVAKITAPITRARFAELKGKIRKVENIWINRVRKSHPKMLSFNMSMLGEFYLRQGNYAKAIDALESAVQSARKQKILGDSLADIEVKLTTALWAAGKREDAIRVTVGAAEVQLGTSASGDEILAKAVLTGHVLTQAGVGSEADKKKARALLEKAAKRFPVGRPYSVESVALVLTGKLPRDKAIERVKNVLKAAPHLDWALWAALYMGLSEPEHAKDLLKMLPEKSLQRRIADIEQKAKASTTTQKTTRPRNK